MCNDNAAMLVDHTAPPVGGAVTFSRLNGVSSTLSIKNGRINFDYRGRTGEWVCDWVTKAPWLLPGTQGGVPLGYQGTLATT